MSAHTECLAREWKALNDEMDTSEPAGNDLVSRTKLPTDKKKVFTPLKMPPSLNRWIDDFIKRHPERFTYRAEWIREACIEKMKREKKRERSPQQQNQQVSDQTNNGNESPASPPRE